MKRLALALALAAVEFCSAAPLTVMIDPGHGGRDHGAIKNGVIEADVTLQVSHVLKALLQKDRRFHVLLSREDDSSVSLYRRAVLAKQHHADIFLSIHVNSSPDARAKGAEFYFQNQLPPDQESMFLAHKENVAEEGETVEPITYDYLDRNKYPTEVAAIVSDLLDGDRVLKSSQLSKELKLHWHGSRKSKNNSVRQAPFYVLNQMRTPSTLVELGYLTNGDDSRNLTSPDVQQKMAEDLYHGLVAYKDSIDKGLQSP
jgi:N-acetylmuramoyl-L-alanine amidase